MVQWLDSTLPKREVLIRSPVWKLRSQTQAVWPTGLGKKTTFFFKLKKRKIRRRQWSAHSGKRMKNLSFFHND